MYVCTYACNHACMYTHIVVCMSAGPSGTNCACGLVTKLLLILLLPLPSPLGSWSPLWILGILRSDREAGEQK